MKKTLNAFIKQSAQSKKGDSFVDNNPQARSNPYEPEMSIREDEELQEGPVWDATKKYGGTYGGPLLKGYSVYTVGQKAVDGYKSDPKASVNRKIANTIDGAMSGNSGEVTAASRTASGKVYRGLQRTAGLVVPSAKVSANAGAAEAAKRVADQAAKIAATKAAGRTALSTGLRVAKFVGTKAPWVAAAMGAYDAAKGYTAQPNAPFSRKLRNAAHNVASGFTAGIIPPPQGVNEAAGLILRGIKAVAPIVKRATAALEKRVAAKAAAADGSNVVKFVPKAAPPKVSVSTPRDATVLNMPKTTVGRAIVKAKAAKKPVTPTTAPTSSKPGTISNLTGKAGRILKSDPARQLGASIAVPYAIDATTPNYYAAPGKDPSMTPSGIPADRAALAIGAGLLAGKSKAAWKVGAAVGVPMAGINDFFQRRDAKAEMSKPEYKKADAAARGQQPTR